jgi:uncharacterized protein (TIGR00369 family)
MGFFAQLRARGTVADYQALLERIPYARFLGIRVDAVAEEGLTIRLVFDRRLVGNPHLPAIHGGVIGAFLEFAAILELVHQSEGEALPKPVDLAIDYLRSAKPEDVLARATITKHGRRVANVRVEAWQGEARRLVAAAHGHFLVPSVAEGDRAE